jgi:hypothetical protein
MLNFISKAIYLGATNPLRIFNFLNKKFFSIPSILELDNLTSKEEKKKIINYWGSLSQKNKNLKKFFFDNQENQNNIKNKNYIFDIKDLNNNYNQVLSSLASNGIIAINNILDNDELNIIQKDFKILNQYDKHKINQIKWITYPKITSSEFKKRIYAKKKMEYHNLDYYVKKFTKEIFGKSLNTDAEYFIDKALKLPEKKMPGDNVIHLDRFIPNVKMIFAPFDINKNSSPFAYVLGSHKINQKYKDLIINGIHKEYSILENKYADKLVRLNVKSNTLIIALTNGYHARTPFYKTTERNLLFMQFANSFNKLSFYKGFLNQI